MTTTENTERSPGNAVRQTYWVKYKQNSDDSSAEAVTLKNGRHAMQATRADCGTGEFRISG